MEINEDTYQVYFFNTSQITKRNILRIVRFKEGTLPNKYLGAPLVESKVKQILWKDLLDKMKMKLENWTYMTLKLPSRLTLVKLVLQAITLHLFSVIAAPKYILKEIRALQRKFL